MVLPLLKFKTNSDLLLRLVGRVRAVRCMIILWPTIALNTQCAPSAQPPHSRLVHFHVEHSLLHYAYIILKDDRFSLS